MKTEKQIFNRMLELSRGIGHLEMAREQAQSLPDDEIESTPTKQDKINGYNTQITNLTVELNTLKYVLED